MPPRSPSSWSQARPLHYGEHSFEAHGPPFVDVITRRSRGDSELLDFSSPCGEFRLRVEGEPPAPPPKDVDVDPVTGALMVELVGLMEPAHECGPGWNTRSDMPVTWQGSGGNAGMTRRVARLPADARESEGKVCFTTYGFGVCIASDKLMRTDCPDAGAPDSE